MKVFVLVATTMVLLLVPQRPAASKELPDGPVAVMRPDGHVFIVSGPQAKRFVRDANSIECRESCDSPEAAAQLAGGPVSGATAERYLVAFHGWGGGVEFNWTAAAWFYPSTNEEPAYLVWPMAIGDERGAWAEWQEATPRMERIVVGLASSSALPFTGSSVPFHALPTIGVAIAILGLLLILLSKRSSPNEVAAQRSANDRVRTN